MATKKGELMTVASDQQLAELGADFQQEPSFTRMLLPRFGMLSQDKTEEVGTGRTKKINLLAAAGTFYFERETEEVAIREDGSESKVWEKEWIEDERPEIVILYKRRQLRYYDEAEEKYTSSPVFDRDDEVVVLFKDRAEVARGMVAELKALYPGVDKKGKPISLLKDELILYVLVDGEMHQLNLHGSSMWSFQAFARKIKPTTVVTVLGSTSEKKGDIAWNKMSFTAKRVLTAAEAEVSIAKIAEIKEAISGEKEFFAGQAEGGASKLDKEFDALTAKGEKDKAF